MQKLNIWGLGIFLITSLLISCSPSQEVSRVQSDTQTDLSGKWNDTDARLVADKITGTLMTSAWLQNQGSSPVMIVGNIKNDTSEHIDTDLFIKEIEQSIVNSQKMNVVADSEEREQLRNERSGQVGYTSAETRASIGQELGADYMLIGYIGSSFESTLDGKKSAKFYTVNLEMVKLENNNKVWIGKKKIKKVVKRRNVKW
jgi:uncharacterized protein (TIGR02722 family)